MKKIVAAGVLLMLCFLASCVVSKKTPDVIPEETEISLLQQKPTDPIALKPLHDSSMVFYFSRSEWFVSAAQVDSSRRALTDYTHLLDSLEKTNGAVSFRKLKWVVAEKWQLNPGRTTQNIFDSLLLMGHVYVAYPDGKPVDKMIAYAVKDFTGETVYFEDSANRRLLYYIARKTEGQF